MKRKSIIALSVVGILVLMLFIGLAETWSHRNIAVDLEERIAAQYKSNQNSYDSMWKKFKELTQVTELQADQMKDVYTDLISGRYEDSDVLFKMVTEDNPDINTSVYTQLQQQIEAGRNSFKNDQDKILDIIREYNSKVRKWIIMSAITGRTRIDENKYIVTSKETQNAFDEKQADVIDLTD
ncbi:MAG: hypothetical protein K0Q47_95 [Sedimentibacter sp.]|jgi:hypothetical protein|nr:hypothetical protein [Sedimentibacter sp.]